jgi:hypothetical protein
VRLRRMTKKQEKEKDLGISSPREIFILGKIGLKLIFHKIF